MRTTVDLPPAVHRRACELAQERGESLSKTIADLTVRGLDELQTPRRIDTDPISGFPVITIGRPITPKEIAEALDDE